MTYSQQLASAIDRWVTEKPNRSISMLARLAQVSYSTARRAAQRECEPTKEVGLAIASVVMEDTEYQDFAKKHWPNLKKYIVDTTYRPNPNDQFLFYLQSEYHCKILILSSSNTGTNSEEVKQKFGSNAVNYFNELIDVGLLKRLHSGNWQCDGDIGFSSFDFARIVLSLFTKMCDKSNDSRKSASTAWVGWESVSEDAAKQLNKIAGDYCSQVSKIIKNPSNRGDVLIFAGILSNILKGEELIT